MAFNNHDGDDEIEYVDDIDNSFSSRADRMSDHNSGLFQVDTTGMNGEGENNSKKLPKVAVRETKNIRRMRIFMLGLIILSTAVVSLTVFSSSRKYQRDNFEQIFHSRALNVMDAVQNSLERQLVALDTMSASISAHVTASKGEWPFIEVPEFSARATSLRIHSNLLSLVLVPVVQKEDRQQWESYTSLNHEWTHEGLEYEEHISSQPEDGSSRRRHLAKEILPPRGTETRDSPRALQNVEYVDGVAARIFRYEFGSPLYQESDGPYYPIWQVSPMRPEDMQFVNFDIASSPFFSVGLEEEELLKSGQAAISEAYRLGKENETNRERDFVDSLFKSRTNLLFDDEDGDPGESWTYQGEPISNLFYPIFDDDKQSVVALLATHIDWGMSLSNIPEASGLVCVLESECDQQSTQFTFTIHEEGMVGHGEGDLHDSQFSDLVETLSLETPFNTAPSKPPPSLADSHCAHSLHIYPSEAIKSDLYSKSPGLFLSLFILLFLVVISLFACYDRLVEKRHRKVARLARDSNAIVASLFPANVRDRLFQDADEENADADDESRTSGRSKQQIFSIPSIPSIPVPWGQGSSEGDLQSSIGTIDLSSFDPGQGGGQAPKQRLKNYLRDGWAGDEALAAASGGEVLAKPIADLFASTTVLFADIAGFTAWSSEREPEQVFTLLQTLYQKFDGIAKRRGVFKVETIGDSYLAVTGLPDPQEDHAVRMVKFARECMMKMHEMTKKLEVALGPDTGDLSLRIGLHSGPVTAGVLRGERSRFQLFGDTVNTASRMESTGLKNKIQISQSTADLVVAAGKDYWIRPREEKIEAKGKGEMQTFWVVPRTSSMMLGSSTHGMLSRSYHAPTSSTQPKSGNALMWGDAQDLIRHNGGNSKATKEERLIDYQVEVLSGMLREIVQFREKMRLSSGTPPNSSGNTNVEPITSESCVIDEVSEAITLEQIDHETLTRAHAIQVSVEPSPEALRQLRHFVSAICSLYRNNPFHSFEHANHVTQSVFKLLSRVKEPDHLYDNEEAFATASDLHCYTHGITSDPLIQFAVAFSALIHDVDHSGVSNAQLIKEKPHIGVLYNNQSVAEQNSVDLAWELLMEPSYEELQKCIYTSDAELRRFRQLVVNVVMATDIFDKDMTAVRNKRWDKAFHRDEESEPLSTEEDANLKATIVLEHLLQASDVSHTMQHWHIYTKWNERLFQEQYAAFEAGRCEKNPADGWYKGELWFFDNYIIPLTKKLEECQVFGVSCDEYLNYALANRREWEQKGENVVNNFVVSYQTSKGLSSIVAISEKQQSSTSKSNPSTNFEADIFSLDLEESKELW